MTLDSCRHERTVTDPALDQMFCEICGLMISSGPVQIGVRALPATEFLRRVEVEYVKLSKEILERQQRQNQLRFQLAKVRGVNCVWPNCHAAPMIRSKWCPIHRHEHITELARLRKRKQRRKH